MSFLGAFRQAVQDALNDAFAETGITFEPGRLPDEAGQDGVVGGVSTDGWAEVAGRVGEANVQVRVQLFDVWGDPIATDGTFDPTVIEGWADQITTAIQAHQHDAGWFMRVTQIQVADDPNGWPSRIVATIVGRTANPFETTGAAA